MGDCLVESGERSAKARGFRWIALGQGKGSIDDPPRALARLRMPVALRCRRDRKGRAGKGIHRPSPLDFPFFTLGFLYALCPLGERG